MHKFTNSLINESSPYLLQHAHNPVNWVAWSQDVFEKAKQENKLVLISVGYSACHWCHVMERECFEDEEVAALMNAHFINVKVDREERPDVDQVYMTAVQLMTQQGGWPLNCFTLPDGRPVYGGTYFPKNQWMHILRSLVHTYENDYEKVLEYAENLHQGVVKSELIDQPTKNEQFEEEKAHELVTRWSRNFDATEGGESRAPKFPLPSNYRFLLYYGQRFQHERVLKHVELSLDKMAMGGIYDQIGGGFARYSVDMLWKVPHFEKMLYDNGQLLSLYSEAYQYFQKPLYKRVVYGIFNWLQRELQNPEGAYYSAMDADSEGEEGKFYCWTKKEWETTLGKDAEWAADLYSINGRGHWENGNYIPLRIKTDKQLCSEYGWSPDELETKIAEINSKLLDERSHRVRPGLDDKCLTSWNAMTIKGFCDAYRAFGDSEFKQAAIRVSNWLETFQFDKNGHLLRTRTNGVSRIEGFLEDYAAVIEAYIALYEITFHAKWAHRAAELSAQVIERFQHPNSKMFYFTSSDTALIARKMDLNDNVIPSGNSIMAHNLFRLAKLFHKDEWKAVAAQQLSNVYDGMEMYGSGYSNWAMLLLHFTGRFYELVVTGTDAGDLQKELQRYYLPGVILAGGPETLPVMEHKRSELAQTFVCFDGTCLLPTNDVQEVVKTVLK